MPISDNPEEFTYMGEAHLFLFSHHDELYSVYLKEDGKVLVTLEPNMTNYEYAAWGDFQKNFVVFADTIKQNIQNKIQTGIERMSRECSQKAFQDVTDRMYC